MATSVSAVLTQYKDQFTTTAETVRRTSVDLGKMAVELQNQAVDLLNPYKDQLTTVAGKLRRRRTDVGGEQKADEQDRVIDVLEEYKAYLEMDDKTVPVANEQEDNQVRMKERQKEKKLQLTDMQTQLIQSFSDMSPVNNDPSTFRFLLDTYLWTAICLLGVSVGQLFGGYLFTFVFDLVITTWMSLLLTNVLLPAYFVFYMRKHGQSLDDYTRCMTMFGLSLVLGVLSGHNLSNRYMEMITPPAFILPLILALGSQAFGPNVANNRRSFLSVTVGAATGIYLMLGFLMDQLCFTYILYTVLLSGWATLDLQMTLSQINKGTMNPVAAQLRSVVGTITIHTLLGFMLGHGKDDAQIPHENTA